jgi:hypothetical protein
MTVVDDRPQMLPEEFEELAHFAARTAEGLQLEFINGRVCPGDGCLASKHRGMAEAMPFL